MLARSTIRSCIVNKMSIFCLRNKPFKDGIHQRGWNKTLFELRKKFHNEQSELAFDDFLEFTFFSKEVNQTDILPYTFNWLGVLHHPSNISHPFDVKFGAPALVSSRLFRASLPTCKGLITLSGALQRDVKVLLDRSEFKDLPIHKVFYPTELNVKQFNISEFDKLPKVVCLGWWLRRMESLFKLKTEYPKFFMLGNSEWARGQYQLMMWAYKEKKKLKIRLPEPDAAVLPFISSDRYDDFLASSIVFLDLIDTSANTAIIECIASSTPVLVNPLDAVVEYLGEDYPFYYDSMEEASEKINNRSLIIETCEYLKSMDKTRFSYEYFVNDIGKIIV